MYFKKFYKKTQEASNDSGFVNSVTGKTIENFLFLTYFVQRGFFLMPLVLSPFPTSLTYLTIKTAILIIEL